MIDIEKLAEKAATDGAKVYVLFEECPGTITIQVRRGGFIAESKVSWQVACYGKWNVVMEAYNGALFELDKAELNRITERGKQDEGRISGDLQGPHRPTGSGQILRMAGDN